MTHRTEATETAQMIEGLILSLDELVSAVEDGLRRHAAGDSNAIASNLISATLRQAKASLSVTRGAR
jgi:hypothetical protein